MSSLLSICISASLFVSSLTHAMPLTLAEAQHRAVLHSRQLAADDFAVTASQEMAVSAAQLPDPVLKVGLDNLPINGQDRFSTSNDFMTMRRIGVMQEMTRTDKRQLRAERFHREAEKTLAEKQMHTAAIERDTAMAWLDRYYTEAMVTVVAQQSEQAAMEISATEAAFRAGLGTQVDVFAARGAAAALADRASEVQRKLRNAKTMLARWIGDAADMADAADLPLAEKPSTDAIRLDITSRDLQLAHHPDIAVYSKKEEVAVLEARLAEANKKSDWSVEVAYQQRGAAYSNMISIGVSMPLQWAGKNRQYRELSSKLALVEEARAERDEMLRTHVAETRVMIDEWQNNRQRLARYESALLPLAQQQNMAAVAAYRGGKAALTAVLAARRNEIEVRLQALQLAAETDRLWAQLNFLFPLDSDHVHGGKNEAE